MKDQPLKDHPFWRDVGDRKNKTPTINQMLKDISQYKKQWNEYKGINQNKLEAIQLSFFVSVQIEEVF